MALVVCVPLHPAKAALVFCNNTQQLIEAAVAYWGMTSDDKEDWISEGWWRIEPGQCDRVYDSPLTNRFYFAFAHTLTSPTDTRAPTVWSGDKYKFCTDISAFKIEGDGNCSGRDHQTKGFQQIDIGPNIRDYTLDFKEGG